MPKTPKKSPPASRTKKSGGTGLTTGYTTALAGMVELLESARRAAARTVNTIMTATYWEVGRRIVELEQKGKKRAGYGEALLKYLAADLTRRFGKGFSERNLEQMRLFYSTWQISQTASAKFDVSELARRFPLSWSHYVYLMTSRTPEAREFYEAEALRGGWTVRQLKRQMNSMFFERTLLSRNKTAMLLKGEKPTPGDALTPEEEIKDPYVLEFLDLKDEYSETELEAALIRHIESFLLELGGDFTFVGRQMCLRIDHQWFRVDLVFFHRRLKCLIIIDLKIGEFTHADAGQMHLYLNYAGEHWTHPDENPPIGLILCERKSAGVVHYALDNLPNKVMAAEYKTVLPKEKQLLKEMATARRALELHRAPHPKGKG
jgi:predicted nuclease of restriction endonuclease-like (RecB) superfamily